jgi:DNA-binding beta-propeller fold protein YncE
MNRRYRTPSFLSIGWIGILIFGVGVRVLADCASFGLPFMDLGSEPGFCAAIAEAYYTGITHGTSPTTFSPAANVTRDQAAALATRTLDASLNRGSRPAALNQWWTTTPHYDVGLGLTSVGAQPVLLASDGADIWVANAFGGSVSRVRASDGKKLEDWTGASEAVGILVAMGRVFVTGTTSPGNLYMIDPTQPPGSVTTLASNLGNGPFGIAFDGNKIWTANTGGSVSIVIPGSSPPWSVTTISTGFSEPQGMVFDGNNIWVTDSGTGTLLRLGPDGAILQTVIVGSAPGFPAFDGHNLWVPNSGANSLGNSVTVIRASDGTVLKTFSAANGDQNGLAEPLQAAFDGQRVLVTNNFGGLSLFKAADLSIIGNPSTPGVGLPFGVCSDGINFWVSFNGSNNIGRF